MRCVLPLLIALAASGCATGLPLVPATDRLQPWTTSFRDAQREGAYAAVYRHGRDRLVFVAATHANRDDSPTFRLIRQAFASFRFDTVIAEGFPTSRGANPPRTIQYARDNGPRADGFVAGGETVPTVMGALEQGAAVWGGEPDDLDIKARLLSAGLPAEDLLGLYILRNIPQWIGEQRIADAGDPRLRPLVAEALTRDRAALQLPAGLLPDFDAWAAWYQRRNGRPIGAGFVTEETGPLADGRFGTNAVAHAISRVRDAHLHELVIRHLSARESVLVVYGGSHLAIQRPALDAALGPPCYVGTDLAAALTRCR